MADPRHTRMFAEAAEASLVVARQRTANAGVMAALASRLTALAPRLLFTCARGSSDHAATFAKYLYELPPILDFAYRQLLNQFAQSGVTFMNARTRLDDTLQSWMAQYAAEREQGLLTD